MSVRLNTVDFFVASATAECLTELEAVKQQRMPGLRRLRRPFWAQLIASSTRPPRRTATPQTRPRQFFVDRLACASLFSNCRNAFDVLFGRRGQTRVHDEGAFRSFALLPYDCFPLILTRRVTLVERHFLEEAHMWTFVACPFALGLLFPRSWSPTSIPVSRIPIAEGLRYLLYTHSF